MSLKYKFNKGAEDGKPPVPPNTTYDMPGSVRNLCFAWPDGRTLFLNYAYLISGELSPAASSIVLTYTTHVVTLSGYRLKTPFNDLTTQKISEVAAVEERYATTQETGSLVTEINVKS